MCQVQEHIYHLLNATLCSFAPIPVFDSRVVRTVPTNPQSGLGTFDTGCSIAGSQRDVVFLISGTYFGLALTLNPDHHLPTPSPLQCSTSVSESLTISDSVYAWDHALGALCVWLALLSAVTSRFLYTLANTRSSVRCSYCVWAPQTHTLSHTLTHSHAPTIIVTVVDNSAMSIGCGCVFEILI